MKKEGIMLILFIGIFLFSILGAVIQNMELKKTVVTGYATTGTTVSNVTISYYLSIAMSANLTQGIFFGSVSALPATDINASYNYDGSNNGSTIFINVSADSNTPVDFCVKGNANLTDSTNGNIIALGNETYNNATTTHHNATSSIPSISVQTGLTPNNVKVGQNVGVGNVTFYRFWLDIPTAQPAGTYNNTVSFEGVRTTTACS